MARKPAKTERTGEFYFLDSDGNKQDRALHGPILGAVGNPVDEKIMAPIRKKHRDRWLKANASS